MTTDPLPQPDDPNLVLVDTGTRLEVQDRGRVAPVFVEFLGDARHVGIRRRTHPLARAVGRDAPLPDVLDGTAGLGRDAFVLACLGYTVTAVERAPVIHALFADGLARLLADPRGRQLVGDRLTLHRGACEEWLARNPPPTVVYLDPMFPPRKKSALVKKEMQLFQRLLGQEDNGSALLAAAREVATRRVVVKRPVWADPLAGDADYSVTGAKVRFDVYLKTVR